MTLHPEVLGAVQERVLRRLGPALTFGRFYLGGGTALALQLGHRRSVDLDWFSEGPLAQPLALAQRLRAQGLPLVTDQVALGTLHGRISGIRVSFLEYTYSLLGPLVPWPECGCMLASLEDLAAMKLAAVADRGVKRDFVDLYNLVIHGFTLRRMIDAFRRKFKVRDTAHVLYSLTYFDDADDQRMPRMFQKTNWRAIKKALRRRVEEELI